MQIVIDIDESTYEFTKKYLSLFKSSEIARAVASGVVLPKGHGRLIDADELELDADWNDYYDGYIAYSESMIKYAPTIVEADKE